jgi:hypothetical protein
VGYSFLILVTHVLSSLHFTPTPLTVTTLTGVKTNIEINYTSTLMITHFQTWLCVICRQHHNINIHVTTANFSGSAAQRGLWPPRSRSLLITQNDAPQSVAILWTSDQLVAETST